MTTDTAAALVRTYKVGKRLRVTFTAPMPRPGVVAAMTAEWDPHIPAALSRKQRKAYEAARQDFFLGLVQQMEAQNGA
jgi:hypothetical protein